MACGYSKTMLKARNFTEEEIELLSNSPYVKDVKELFEPINEGVEIDDSYYIKVSDSEKPPQ